MPNLKKHKIMIGGKQRVVYTGPKGGKYYMKKNYLKRCNYTEFYNSNKNNNKMYNLKRYYIKNLSNIHYILLLNYPKN